MKKIYTMIIAATCLLFATSCNDKSDEVIESGNVEVIESDLTYEAAGGSDGYVIVRSSLGEITATSNESWCTITSVEGNTVHVAAAVNPNVQGRTALVTISSGYSSTQVPAHQYGIVTSIVDTTARKYDRLDQVDTISVVNSSVPVTVTTSESWATATVDANNNIVIHLTENTGGDRTCTLTVTAGNESYTVTIIQEGILVVSSDTVYIAADGTAQTITVTAPSSYTATAADSWCTPTISGSTLSIACTTIPGTTPRTTKITIVSQSVQKIVVVIQVPAFNDVFAATTTQWFLEGVNSTYACPAFITAWNSAQTANEAKYSGESLSGYLIGANPWSTASTYPYVIAFLSTDGSSNYWSTYGITITPVSGTSDQISIVGLGGANNYPYYTHCVGLVDFILNNSPWKLVPDNANNPTSVKIVSVANSAYWLVLSL